MREFVKFIFHNDLTLFILCFVLTFAPIYGIMLIHSEKDKK